MKRRYAGQLASKRSPRWAFMEWFTIPDYSRPDAEGNYLVRLRIIQTPWFGIYLHRFDGPDPRDTLHDHPWKFLSIVLRGGYIERRLDPMTRLVDERHRVTRINYMPLQSAHAITHLLRQPTWTLMFVGRRVRTWGYIEPRSIVTVDDDDQDFFHEFWRWTEFNKHPHDKLFQEALKRRKEGTTV